jgi:hypothetical protein
MVHCLLKIEQDILSRQLLCRNNLLNFTVSRAVNRAKISQQQRILQFYQHHQQEKDAETAIKTTAVLVTKTGEKIEK